MMKISKSGIKQLATAVALLFIGLSTMNTLHAQTGASALSGRVSSQEEGNMEELPAAAGV